MTGSGVPLLNSVSQQPAPQSVSSWLLLLAQKPPRPACSYQKLLIIIIITDYHRDLHKHCSVEQLQGPAARPQGSPESSSHQTAQQYQLLTTKNQYNYYCIDFGINNSVLTSAGSETLRASFIRDVVFTLYNTTTSPSSEYIKTCYLLQATNQASAGSGRREYFTKHLKLRNAMVGDYWFQKYF